uniref:Hydantoinase B/oxoprolinase n=1 Tax=Candidatus Kentrum sp. LPFa TaxID=2126335 RepID=A0A450W1G3_9GAMM|nr:MAG: Hydantoinase B/oxoprolinase [Candidatus Kentron sp. LPFa]
MKDATDPEREQRFPVLLGKFAIRKGSGGTGRFRGGDGVIRRIRFLEPLSAGILSNHRKIPPFGMAGGEPGRVGRNWVERADGRCEELASTEEVSMEAGDVLVIETPGGGGSWIRNSRNQHRIGGLFVVETRFIVSLSIGFGGIDMAIRRNEHQNRTRS